MKEKLSLILCLVLLIGICCANVVLYRTFKTSLLSYKVKEININKQQENCRRELRSQLCEWIYKKYTRSSRETILKIIDESMETKHPFLILALFGAESEFNPTAKSSVGALGLGQIMPKYYADILKKEGIIKEIRDLYNVTENIKATEYALLYELERAEGNFALALSRYSGGASKYFSKVAENYIYLTMIKKNTYLKYGIISLTKERM